MGGENYSHAGGYGFALDKIEESSDEGEDENEESKKSDNQPKI